MVLNDSHKMFVQGMMARRCVLENDGVNLLSVVTGRNSSKNDLDKVVKQVNEELKKFFLEIKEQMCDITNKNYFVLISCLPASSSQDEVYHKCVHAYDATEREYFRNIMEEIIASDERCIRSHSALNLTVAGGSSQSQNWGPLKYSEKLKLFTEDGWLATLEDGKYFLGARAIAELEHVLVNDYKMDSCNLCSRVCVLGLVCDVCSIMVHIHCWKKFTHGRKGGSNKCQKCDSEMRRT